jgi:hypothetical protein
MGSSWLRGWSGFLAGLAVVLSVLSGGGLATENRRGPVVRQLPARLVDAASIEEWANRHYRGHESHAFDHLSKDGCAVVVIIGTNTSGVESGEIVVFLRRPPDPQFRLLLFRKEAGGAISVRDEGDRLVFDFDAGAEKGTLLIMPWRGID